MIPMSTYLMCDRINNLIDGFKGIYSKSLGTGKHYNCNWV